MILVTNIVLIKVYVLSIYDIRVSLRYSAYVKLKGKRLIIILNGVLGCLKKKLIEKLPFTYIVYYSDLHMKKINSLQIMTLKCIYSFEYCEILENLIFLC